MQKQKRAESWQWEQVHSSRKLMVGMEIIQVSYENQQNKTHNDYIEIKPAADGEQNHIMSMC